MSKSDTAAGAPAAEPVWIITLAEVKEIKTRGGAAWNIPDGRCLRVSAAEAGRLIATGAARQATDADLAIGQALARDLA